MKHLIHIGYPKAASTFLQEWFRQNPQLKYNHGALAGYYNIYEVCREATRDDATDYKYFVTSSEAIVSPRETTGIERLEFGLRDFEFKSFRASQAKVRDTLKRLFPDGEILLITRGYKGFFYSGYSQYLRAGGIYSWENFITKFIDQNLDMFGEVCDYDYIYKIYAEAFGEKNLIVLPYELLRDDKKKFISIIENRLGISHFEDTIGRLNESLSAEELYWYPRISYRVSNFVQKFGWRFYRKIYPLHIYQTGNRRFKRIAGLLANLREESRTDSRRIPENLINAVQGRAGVLADNPLYKPYLSEYFLDN